MQFLHTVYCVFFQSFLQLTLKLVFCLFALVSKKRCYLCWVWYPHSNSNLMNTIPLNLSKIICLQRHNQSQKFWVKLVKNRQKHYKGIDIYCIGYITIKRIHDCENIYNVNPLYLLVNQTSGYIETKSWNNYLIFDDSVNENNELLGKYADVWDGIKSEIKAINGGKENDYGKN